MPESITLDGVRHVLRPDIAAVSRIEQSLGSGLIALSRKLSAGEMTLRELSLIVAAILQDGQPDDIAESLLRSGLANSFAAVASMLANLFEGAAEPVTHAELIMLCERFPDIIAPAERGQ